MNQLIIMGVDPGTAICGYSVVEYTGDRFRILEYGAITTDAGMALAQRLAIVYRGLEEVMARHSPDHFAIEELFFNKNTRTAMSVGHARGVAMLAAARKGIPVFEYTPLQVKQSVVGLGRASKDQVLYMVRVILSLKETPRPDDVSDALAVSVCHAFRWTGMEALKQ